MMLLVLRRRRRRAFSLLYARAYFFLSASGC